MKKLEELIKTQFACKNQSCVNSMLFYLPNYVIECIRHFANTKCKYSSKYITILCPKCYMPFITIIIDQTNSLYYNCNNIYYDIKSQYNEIILNNFEIKYYLAFDDKAAIIFNTKPFSTIKNNYSTSYTEDCIGTEKDTLNLLKILYNKYSIDIITVPEKIIPTKFGLKVNNIKNIKDISYKCQFSHNIKLSKMAYNVLCEFMENKNDKYFSKDDWNKIIAIICPEHNIPIGYFQIYCAKKVINRSIYSVTNTILLDYQYDYKLTFSDDYATIDNFHHIFIMHRKNMVYGDSLFKIPESKTIIPTKINDNSQLEVNEIKYIRSYHIITTNKGIYYSLDGITWTHSNKWHINDTVLEMANLEINIKPDDNKFNDDLKPNIIKSTNTLQSIELDKDNSKEKINKHINDIEINLNDNDLLKSLLKNINSQQQSNDNDPDDGLLKNTKYKSLLNLLYLFITSELNCCIYDKYKLANDIELNDSKYKKILINYSGGYDSTYLLMINLLNDKNIVIIPNYVIIEENYTKSCAELLCILNNISILSQYFPNRIYKPLISMRASITTSNGEIYGYSQPQLWLTSLTYINYNKYHISNIQFGYIQKDEMISYIPEIKKIYSIFMKSFIYPGEASNTLIKNDIIKYPKLEFPLSKIMKPFIYTNINELNKLYFNNKIKYTTCEKPKISYDKENGKFTIISCEECNTCENLLNVKNKFN